MPILPANPLCFPADLGDCLETEELEGVWWCAHCKPRQEKVVAGELLLRAVRHYLPQATRMSRTPGGRTLRSVIPLFPGYIFFHGGPVQRLDLLRTDRVVRVLDVPSQSELLEDLRQIRQLGLSGLPLLLEPRYVVGARVRIASGPLAGLIGTVVRRGQRDRFTAMVRFLGQGTSVELEDWQVESLGAA